MSIINNDNTIVVIRAQGERTEDLCEYLVRQQFDDVIKITISPFTEAIKECYRIGIDSNKRYLLTIDADVLIRPDFKEKFKVGSGWQTIGKMICKFGGVRDGGVRVHRNEKLKDKTKFIKNVLRPESYLCKKFPNITMNGIICGFHDYEQYNKDLYRKGKNYNLKFGHRWDVSNWVNQDNDFNIAYAGFMNNDITFEEKEKLEINTFMKTEYNSLMGILNKEEI